MTDSVQKLRERIARTRVNRRGYRLYSEELRRDIQAHALMGLKRGASHKDISCELGLAAATLQNWLRGASLGVEEPARPMGFRPVEVRGARPDAIAPAPEFPRLESASQPVVVFPSGIRVEGLSATALSSLLEELGWR